MKLVVIGTGYVGLVSGLCFAEFGFETICVDKDKSKIDFLKKGKSYFFEPYLNQMLKRHLNKTKLFSLSQDLPKSVNKADVIFITVGTPTKRLDDQADLTQVYGVAKEISKNLKKYSVIVTKSTVPVGTTRKIKEIISKNTSSDNFDVVSNPEFLREGSAINDFMKPDRVVIGVESKKAENIMRKLYKSLYLLKTPIVTTSIESSEIIKYASNSFLATKISFINQVADYCEKAGGNVQDVAKAMGIDKRIGSKYLQAGPGFGGSCFPKDVSAFISSANKLNVDFSILKAVNYYNEQRPKIILKKIKKCFSNNISNKTFCLLGLSFKPNTDDLRSSISIKIAKLLIGAKSSVKSYDPVAMEMAKRILPRITYCDSVKEACKNADAVIIATEWNDFTALDFKKLKKILKKPIVFDLRNIYIKTELTNLGYKYFGIGT